MTTTLPQILQQAADRFGDGVAIEDGALRLSYHELEGQARLAAKAYISMGLGAGERVGIWAPNCAEWIISALGAHLAGGVLVPLNTRLKGREAGDILRRSGARALVCPAEFLGVRPLELLRGQALPELKLRIVLSASGATQPDEGAISWREFLASCSSCSANMLDQRSAAVTADSLADIMYTSGTTGLPKGVMSTHGQNVRAFAAWSEIVELSAADRYLIVNPFFHTFGYKAGWLACLLSGATILPMAVFDPAEVMRRIPRDRVTVLPGPPALFQSLLAHPDCGAPDVSSLRVAVTGAANVPVKLIERMHDELGFTTVITGYGLTESTGLVTMCRPGDDAQRIARTCGKAIPEIEVRCADEQGATVPAGIEGEVLVRGYNVMRGYFNDPAATAAAIDADGWLHTGDIGVLDAEGYLRITDRKKDMFIVGGFNCYPAEIENIIASHPAVAQVAVVGVPDERLGEVARAFVIRRAGHELDETRLVAWCRENMANYKVPRSVSFVAELPTTASGKVQRFALRT
jgi:acyl-CoA synthetase (AMP-forming)/AMP-acid ligase II